MGASAARALSKILSHPAVDAETRRGNVGLLRSRRSFLSPLHLRPAHFRGTARRRPAHALAGICCLQLPRCGPLGHSASPASGYLFGQHWRTLARAMQRFNIAVLIVAVAAILFLWWRHRRHPT